MNTYGHSTYVLLCQQRICAPQPAVITPCLAVCQLVWLYSAKPTVMECNSHTERVWSDEQGHTADTDHVACAWSCLHVVHDSVPILPKSRGMSSSQTDKAGNMQNTLQCGQTVAYLSHAMPGTHQEHPQAFHFNHTGCMPCECVASLIRSKSQAAIRIFKCLLYTVPASGTSASLDGHRGCTACECEGFHHAMAKHQSRRAYLLHVGEVLLLSTKAVSFQHAEGLVEGPADAGLMCSPHC